MKRLELSGKYQDRTTRYNPLYRAWRNMKTRCYNSHYYLYHRYGGRGIKVCDRWLESFENFYADMQSSYFNKAQLDRIDNDGDYSPSNCKWSTAVEQSRNRSVTKRVLFKGQNKTIKEWSEQTGLCYRTINNRLHSGWPASRALTESVAYRGPK